MPTVEIEFKCKRCGNAYPVDVAYSGGIESLDLDEHRSRCPYCGEQNCADPSAVESAKTDAMDI